MISSVEASDGTKSKFELLKVSVETAAQTSGQNILCIAFSKMVGLPPTSAHRLRDCAPYLAWKDLKMNFQGNFQQHCLTVMPPKPLSIYNRVLMSYLKYTKTVLVNFCQKLII